MKLSPLENTIFESMAGPLPTLSEARDLRALVRAAHGFKQVSMPLLTAPDKNTKLAKSERPTYGLALSPARSGGFGNTCPFSTAECRKYCVSSAGNGSFSSCVRGRAAKTELLARHGAAFRVLLVEELRAALARERLRARIAHKRFRGIAVRLNTFSDVRWELLPIAADLVELADAGVRFYDYTKFSQGDRPAPSWYHLTRSYVPGRSTLSDDSPNAVVISMSVQNRTVKPAIAAGALVLDLDTGSRSIVSGDLSDERWNDAPGSIVVLTRKGSLPRTSSFVVPARVRVDA